MSAEALFVVITCSVGLSVCFGFLIFYFARFLLKKIKRKPEEFEFEENTLTINLVKDKKKK